ncbi:MAG: AAA family ATPase [Coriobacteriia bacterium]|nr:AAA family ATPase [Coriobacteriia bacterium]
MLQSLFIQNFRAWENQTFTFNGEHAVFVGGNDSGKSSVLQALDCFFNREEIDSSFVRDKNKDVSIGIRYNGVTYKKTFSAKTLRVKSRKPAAHWHDIESIHYIYLPANLKTSDTVMKELAKARADMLLPEQLQKALSVVAQRAVEQVLAGAGVEMPADPATAKVSVIPKVVPSRAVDFTVETNGIPVAGNEIGHQKRLTFAMLVGSNYRNVVLGVDDVERAFSSMDYETVIAGLESHVGQVLMTTHATSVLQHRGVAMTVPVGSNPGSGMAAVLKGLESEGKAFLLVEGKYDLPWYKAAARLAGFGQRLDILPAGGSNLDELRREMARVGMKCVAIVDGDTAPDERVGKFALARECVELYTPDELLMDLFGIVPPLDAKKEFFRGIQATRQASENGIKAAISEHIASYLDANSPFVVEVGDILRQAL